MVAIDTSSGIDSRMQSGVISCPIPSYYSGMNGQFAQWPALSATRCQLYLIHINNVHTQYV
jgi:hypothetical protein